MKDKPVILIVDDQPQNIALLEAYLAPQGYEIVTAANGEEALGKLSANQIDLILLDVMMPGLDGFEVTRRVRQDDAHRLLPIILVTSLHEREDRVKGIEAGCDDFISKPVDKMELLARVRSLLKVKAFNDLLSNYRKELEESKIFANEAREYVENIINTVREPLLALDQNLRVVSASRSFYEFFKVKAEETLGQLIYDLGNKQWDIPKLRELLKTILPQKVSFDNYEVEHDFATIGRRVMLLNARQIERGMGKERIILLAIEDITERKRAEYQREAALELLLESEKYFKEITENSSDIIIITDKDGGIKYCSRSVERFTGYTPEEIIGKSGFTLIHPDDVERAIVDYGKAMMATGSVVPNAFRIVHKDGSERYFEGLGKNLLDNPAVAGFVMNVRDITGRKQAESQREAALDALRESEARYRTLFEKSRDAIMILEPPSWKFTAGNPTAIEMFKVKDEEEFVSCDPWKFSPAHQPDGRASKDKAKEMIEKAIRDGFNYFEWTHKRISGEEFPATVLLSKVEKNGNVFLQATVRDITARRKAENTIKESEERFRSIVFWSEDAIIVTDAEGKIEFMNPAAGTVFNREVESFIGTNFGLSLVNGESTEMDIFRPGKDPGVGDMYVVETEWLGRRAHLVTIRDITERKHIEEKIKKAQEELFIMNNKLEERNHQNNLLSEMRELLQSCSNVQEVPAIVISYTAKLFPGTDGALFLLSDSKSDLQSVAKWGNFPEDVDSNIFAPDACWGLRQGHVYTVEDMNTGPICPHLKQQSSTAYICLPLIGKGEILGLLHLGTKLSVKEDDKQANILKLKEIAILFAEYLSLSIANIQLSEKLISQSIRDPLTGLYNRRYMEESIQHEILRAARQTLKIGVVMIDIDHFKQINDTYGHDAGDEFLIKLAGFFKLKLRGSDFIFRYGGEEFLLVLPESSVDDTYKYAETLRKEVKNMKINFRGQQLPAITLSFGIAEYPDHGLDTIELIRIADKALYVAKEEGRDRVVIG